MLLVITGGTGSLGQAIINQQELLKERGITKIRILSRDEQKQVALMKSYEGTLPLKCHLADVSDKERMLFGLRDAHFVIHAAAQKHIDKFEQDPKTGYKNNILGTQNVAEALLASKNARAGVFVSTDKAALPITTYGVSKLASEHLWKWHNSFQKEVRFNITRYGNIFKSRGSVIETWIQAAKEGKPLRITEPECTRFFMKINDAAKFVINALFSTEKEVFIPTMKAAAMGRLAHLIGKTYGKDGLDGYGMIPYRGIEKQHEILEPAGLSSDQAEQFTDLELEEMLKDG